MMKRYADNMHYGKRHTVKAEMSMGTSEQDKEERNVKE